MPAADTIRALGNSRVFAAVAKDASDSVVAGQTFAWSSSDTLIAKVDTLGIALAIGNGTATITATTAGVPGTATLLVQQVVASVHVTPDTATLATPGLTQQFTAQAFDSNTIAVTGKTFTWASTNPLIATVNAAGLATALVPGIDTITATADGVTDGAVLTILTAVHSADIIADETWTGAGSPHIVSGVLKIRAGATLTIEDQATVKFDSGAGLQVGDNALAEAGSLVMLGTPGSIHLTANSATPAPGFWQGIEVQKAVGPQIWRNVDIEYGGGPRPNPFDEGCILLVDPAASVELDSLHIRQCVHAGVHHFAGSLHMHRSEIDSVTGAGIHAEYVTGPPVLQLDSTTIRGSGEEGLFIANNFVSLTGATGNRFVGNAIAGVHMFGSHLSGFGLQDSIAGNGFGAGGVGDSIVVDSGTVGYGVPAFTIFRQAAPYLFTGSLNVWSSTGVDVTLDSGVVMAFDTTAYMSVGDFADSAGNSSGVSANLISLGTAASPVVLRNRQGRPGWGGLYLGSQSGTPVLRHLRLVHGGYQASFGGGQDFLIIGFFEPLNANLWVDAPLGSAPLAIDSIVSDSSYFHGIVVKRGPPQGIRVRDNLIRQSAGTGLVSRARQYNAADTISGNTITGNFYALDLPAHVLPGLGANTFAGNARDTLLLHGGTLVASDTLPQLGFRWRVTQSVTVDSGAVFSVLAGDTVVFDPNVMLTIGGAVPSALNATGTVGAPILFTTPSGLYWSGLEFANLSASGAVSNLVVERAGAVVPCPFDCLPTFLAAIRYRNASANPLTLDAVTVRESPVMALDVDSAAASPVTVQNSLFYRNPYSPMIKSPSPLLLAIHGSDLYHYNGQIIQTANAGTDSIDATGNWWGDVAALYQGFSGNDSLGRASLDSSRVLFDSISGPHFPVGPA
ncbi:MAG TPA: Ig-like domain-containing protein, partial [Jatrophihabitantaceae bacterium]|nr:Ig-like domain-containing protein [Jatrophihabitantaceae bacterium]